MIEGAPALMVQSASWQLQCDACGRPLWL